MYQALGYTTVKNATWPSTLTELLDHWGTQASEQTRCNTADNCWDGGRPSAAMVLRRDI